MQTTIKCQIITPMFMAGADGRTPELRPSEFKGMMRFWWRAMKAEEDIQELKREESKIFGGTGENEGKSKFSIKIKYDKDNLKRFIGENLKKDYRLEWEFAREKNSLKGRDSGIGYLLYSTILPQREREFIKDGFDFSLEISGYEEDIIKHTLASLWLSIYLGGFGTRARRGGGNLTVLEANGETYNIDFIPNGKNKSEIKNWLYDNLNKIKNIIAPSGTNKYSNLKGSQILVFDGRKSWKEALNFLGAEFKNFRSKNKSDLWNMSAFGMPVMHNRFSVRMVPYKGNERISERMSSPIIFKVIKSNELYFPVIIKLTCNIGMVGREEKRREWEKSTPKDIKSVTLQRVDEFINSLKGSVEFLKL